MMKVVSSSEALLALANMHPSYVSQNDVDAQKECDVIFPLGFTSVSEEEAEAEMMLAGVLEPENPDEEEQCGSAEENAAQNNELEPKDGNGKIQEEMSEQATIEAPQIQVEKLEEANNAENNNARENSI